MNWIKCSDELPQSDEVVMFYCPNSHKVFIGYRHAYTYDSHPEWNHYEWYVNGARSRSWHIQERVTHWCRYKIPEEDL